MNRFRLLWVLTALICCRGLCDAGVKTVNVKIPGTLAQKIGEKNKYTTKALKIKGTLNSEDVRFLRDMAGGDTLFNPTPGILTDIDLSEVSFIPGSKSFLKDNSEYRINGRHSIPPTFLYKCPVERVILPTRLDSIDSWAFSDTRLRELIVPDDVYIGKSVIAYDSLLVDLRLPNTAQAAVTPSHYQLPAIRRISLGDVDYVSGGSFVDLPDLEEIVFEGLVGHMDGYVITNCPKLKRVAFKGPVASTGGSQFVKDCPELEEVSFEGLVFGTGFGAPVNCPKLEHYTQTGVVLYGDSDVFKIGNLMDVTDNPKFTEQARRLIAYKSRILANPNNSFLERIEVGNFSESVQLAEALGDKEFISTYEKIVNPIREDMEKSHLQILRESPKYNEDDVKVVWTYAYPSDSILALDRTYFNLDSIAGSGDDISRIKNLMYWVHEAVRHDGGSYNPDSKSLIDLYEICKKEDRGVNCRMMAIMLTEALLAEGIPARYLTCQPKLWKYDSDCHVICVAWSESLGKWVWVDPTFAAFVTDENGIMLHPGEVRERLIEGRELILNPDANWNHKSQQTKENYLENYMAKNLYYITAVTHNRSRPEGTGSKKSTYVLLSPDGTQNTPNYNIKTTDYDTFWLPPTTK